MLEIRCGAADRSHENRFFRYFASQLRELFDRTGKDGVLLGMPECKVRDNLQIDALLITDSSLSIIDFKDYGDCEVSLPGEDDFEGGLWSTSEGITVRGGSCRNPYSQLMRQRRLLKEILDRLCRHKTGSFDSAHISTVVCFTRSVTIRGAIPGWAKLKFFIADSENFLEQIHDIVNVRGVGLLGSEFATTMLDRLFEAQPYDCDMRPTEPFAQAAPREPQQEFAEEPPAEPEEVQSDDIHSFFEGDEDVLIIASTDPALRADLARKAQRSALAAGFSEALILSPTKLAGDSLCAGLPLDGSLYSEVYDFSSKARRDDGTEYVMRGKLAKRSSLRYEGDHQPQGLAAKGRSDESTSERTALIVCEGQLVTSECWLDGPIVFGSGRLLPDALEYMEIVDDNKGRNKIVFIGDDCQLGIGSPDHSSMNEKAYPQGVHVSRKTIAIESPTDGYTEFVSNLADCIRASEHSLFSADVHASNPRIDDGSLMRSLIIDVSRNWRTHKIVTYAHGHADKLNLYIKQHILQNGEDLCEGDVLVFNDAQFEATACDPLSAGFPTRRIRNGEFATVSHVGGPLMRLPVDAVNGEDPGQLTIVPVRFYPEGCPDEYEACLILEYLSAPKARMSTAQEVAIKRRMGEIERAKRLETPFGPGNRWYEQMLSEGNYIALTDESGAVHYRQRSDRRKLTPQESEFRRHVERAIDVPGSAYHQLKNLARARYGWALTAHKAQYYQWDTVTLSARTYTTLDSGRSSDIYFRFLYTGSTRAREQLYVVRWEDVSPFAKTTFDESPSNVRKRTKKSVLLRTSPDLPVAQQIASLLERSLPSDIEVSHSGSSNWREAFTFSRNGRESVIAFDYNKAGEVFSPRRERGDTALFVEVSDALSQEERKSPLESPMLAAYDYAQSLDAGKTSISLVRADRYRDEIRVENAAGSFHAVVHYGNDRAASRVELQSGDSDAFNAFRRLLIKTDDSPER